MPDGGPDQKRFHYAPGIPSQPAPATNIPPPNHRHHPYSRIHNTQPPTSEPQVPPGMVVLHTHAVTQAAPPPQPSQPSPPYGLHPAVPAAPQHRLLTPAEARSFMLEEENVVLRRRLEELKKQVNLTEIFFCPMCIYPPQLCILLFVCCPFSTGLRFDCH